MSVLLETRSVSKNFGTTRALDGVDFNLRSGETHILFGENGAGKSTLVKILSGVYPPDRGTIVLNGEPVEIASPHDARRRGVATVFQDFSLVPTLNVSDNLFLGREMTARGLLDRRAMRARIKAVFSRLGLDIDPSTRVDRLGRADQQMIEIAKALIDDVRVLILDEPTSSLTDSEARRLFAVMEQLKRDSCGIVFISHRMNEIMELGDRITVLRDGTLVSTLERGTVEEEKLIQLITGTTRDALFPARGVPSGEIAVSFDSVSAKGLDNISFDLRRGEILGLAGLAGSGTSLVGRTLFGLAPTHAGTIRLDGQPVVNASPERMLKSGVIFFPSDRHGEGLLPNRSVKENLTIEAIANRFVAGGFINQSAERNAAEGVAARFKIKTSGLGAPVTSLSGGNQQKVVLARGLLRDFRVLILDDPTIGVDMQTKAEIYHLLSDLAAEGLAILLISSDIEEILGLSHRVLVLRDGKMAAEPVATETARKDELLTLFFPAGTASSDPTMH